jgi:hypothetical protein
LVVGPVLAAKVEPRVLAALQEALAVEAEWALREWAALRAWADRAAAWCQAAVAKRK